MRSDATMTQTFSRARRLALLGTTAAALLLGATACNEFLTATNPGAVEEPDVNIAANAGSPVNARS